MDYKLGRNAPKNTPALAFADIRASLVIPEHPASYDTITSWGGWKILGNDSYGDCVAVTWATVRRIVTRLAGKEVYPPLDQVLQFYRTQNPDFNPNGTQSGNGPGSNADGGMVIQTALEELLHNGGPDGVKALAFAKVDHTNAEEMKAALATFNFLWLGVNVTDANEREFPDTPWSRQGNVLGGHSITGVGYDPDKFIMETWAEEAALSNDFMRLGTGDEAGVEEAWIVIWPEHAVLLDAAQRSALNAAYRGLTGRDIDWSSVPEPAPVPDDPEEAFVQAAHEWLSHHHTSHVNVAFVKATKAYLEVLGK